MNAQGHRGTATITRTTPDHADGFLAGTWYTTEELARLFKVDPSSLRRWRTSAPVQGPPFVRLTDRVTIYSARDVEAWLRGRRIDPGAAV